jgi:hypothetical protein
MSPMTPPPLPDLDELATTSAWMGGRDGLAAELDALRAHAERTLPRIRKQAESLAKPRW